VALLRRGEAFQRDGWKLGMKTRFKKQFVAFEEEKK